MCDKEDEKRRRADCLTKMQFDTPDFPLSVSQWIYTSEDVLRDMGEISTVNKRFWREATWRVI